MTTSEQIQSIVHQLSHYVRDKEVEGRVSADLSDIAEVCNWLLKKLESVDARSWSRDELESFLIDLDVNVLQHLDFHLKSMRNDLPGLLRAVASEEDE